jgi:hypothetical protein
MLNHRVKRVGPLKSKVLQPFGRVHRRNITLNHSIPSNGTVAAPIGAYAIEKYGKGWDNIKTTRAKMCVSMLKEHGVDFNDNKDKCVVFMDKQCKEKSGTGICSEWYDLLERLKNGEDISSAAPSPATAAAPSSAPPGGLTSEADTDYKSWSKTSMDEGEKLPSQGFQGKLVSHDNMVTQTSDWHQEYGPDAGKSYEAICAEYPDNMWCRLRGYHGTPEPKSGTQGLVVALPPLIAALVMSLC